MAPYELQSALGAGLADAAGFMAGQTERKRYLAEQQMQANRDAQVQADAAARRGMERSNQEATQQQRAQQIAIAQANAERQQKKDDEEAQKQKLLDTFKGEERDFFGHEMALSPDPVKRLGQLQKRYDIERGKGYDTKSTEAQMNKAATEIEQARRDAALAKQRDTSNNMRQQSLNIRVSGGGSEKPLTRYQQIELDHWNKTHNPDGTTKGTGAARDTTGMTAGAKTQYDKDRSDWMLHPDDGPEPEPGDPKYAKKSTLGGGGASSAPKPVMHNGKAYYLHSDGNYYLTP